MSAAYLWVNGCHQTSSGAIRHHQTSSGISRHHQASDVVRRRQASSGARWSILVAQKDLATRGLRTAAVLVSLVGLEHRNQRALDDHRTYDLADARRVDEPKRTWPSTAIRWHRIAIRWQSDAPLLGEVAEHGVGHVDVREVGAAAQKVDIQKDRHVLPACTMPRVMPSLNEAANAVR